MSHSAPTFACLLFWQAPSRKDGKADDLVVPASVSHDIEQDFRTCLQALLVLQRHIGHSEVESTGLFYTPAIARHKMSDCFDSDFVTTLVLQDKALPTQN